MTCLHQDQPETSHPVSKQIYQLKMDRVTKDVTINTVVDCILLDCVLSPTMFQVTLIKTPAKITASGGHLHLPLKSASESTM